MNGDIEPFELYQSVGKASQVVVIKKINYNSYQPSGYAGSSVKNCCNSMN
jgi:hypothetical protein